MLVSGTGGSSSRECFKKVEGDRKQERGKHNKLDFQFFLFHWEEREESFYRSHLASYELFKKPNIRYLMLPPRQRRQPPSCHTAAFIYCGRWVFWPKIISSDFGYQGTFCVTFDLFWVSKIFWSLAQAFKQNWHTKLCFSKYQITLNWGFTFTWVLIEKKYPYICKIPTESRIYLYLSYCKIVSNQFDLSPSIFVKWSILLM